MQHISPDPLISGNPDFNLLLLFQGADKKLFYTKIIFLGNQSFQAGIIIAVFLFNFET